MIRRVLAAVPFLLKKPPYGLLLWILGARVLLWPNNYLAVPTFGLSYELALRLLPLVVRSIPNSVIFYLSYINYKFYITILIIS